MGAGRPDCDPGAVSAHIGAGALRRSKFHDDERGMTAVIEFLTAFVLFLVIVSAFLSLSQLRLGPNLPGVDRLDEDAVSGLRLITSSSGWWVEHGQNGTRDASNGSSDWHLISADRLASADVLPGLAAADGDLDESRLRALYNVTQSAMRDG